RRAEEQRRRAERGDGEVLQPRLERALQVVVDRAHHVEGDREPLERKEQHHQVRRADEERHSGARGEQEREELRHVVVAPLEVGVAAPAGDVLDREERRGEPDAAEDDLAEHRPAVAVEGSRDDRVAVSAVHVEPDREHEAGHEAGQRAARRRDPPCRARHEHGAEERTEGGAGEREDRTEPEPVDGRRVDHLNWLLTAAVGESGVKEWLLMPAGHTERKSSPATSGTTSASSPGRRSSASLETVEPRASCRTAEISRSMYIAASTIAPAPIADHHQARWKTPARMRNSPAN